MRDATILIWPEIRLSVLPDREADAMAEIAELLPKGTVLITGSVRAPDLPRGTPITRAYNSIYVIDHDGSVLSVYDKLHLVPFGEFLPYQDLMRSSASSNSRACAAASFPAPCGTHCRCQACRPRCR